MRITFRPEARAETLEAQAWYESRAAGLGLEFARSVDAAMAAATRNPQAFAIVHGDLHRVLLRKFPYSLVYRANDEEFLVLALFHHRRDPLALARRIKPQG